MFIREIWTVFVQEKEQIAKDRSGGIKTEAQCTTVNELYELWKVLK